MFRQTRYALVSVGQLRRYLAEIVDDIRVNSFVRARGAQYSKLARLRLLNAARGIMTTSRAFRRQEVPVFVCHTEKLLGSILLYVFREGLAIESAHLPVD